MPTIFVSYLQRDLAIAEYVIKQLHARGAEFADSVKSADVVLLIQSPGTTESARVGSEIAAAIRLGKRLVVLMSADMTQADLVLDVPGFRLTRPEEATDTLHKLAFALDLPQEKSQPVTLLDITQLVPAAPTSPDISTKPFPPEAQDALFFTAADLSEKSPGKALFLYRCLLRRAPDYLGGHLDKFIQQFADDAVEQKLQALREKFNAVLTANDLDSADVLIQEMSLIMSDHPLTVEALAAYKNARVEQLWLDAQALAKEAGWGATTEFAKRIQQLAPNDERAFRIQANIEQASVCDIVYAQAEKALHAKQTGAFMTMMRYMRQHCPDYGDPQGLWLRTPIRAEFATIVTETADLQDHTGAVRALAFSPDGTLLVSGGADSSIRLWDVETTQRVAILRTDDRVFRCLSFSSDGTSMLSTAANRLVRIWSMPEGREAVLLDQFDSDVVCAIFAPDMPAVYCGYANGRIELLDLNDGSVLSAVKEHTYSVNALALTPDGQTLISASDDSQVKLWSLDASGQIRGRSAATLTEHSMLVNAVAVSYDGRVLASVSNDQHLILWDISDSAKPSRIAAVPYKAQLRAAAFSPATNLLVVGSLDGNLYMVNGNNGETLATIQAHSRVVSSLAFSPDGILLVSGGGDDVVKFWQLG